MYFFRICKHRFCCYANKIMKGQNIMKKLLNLLERRPDLFEQTNNNIWDDDHISKLSLIHI